MQLELHIPKPCPKEMPEACAEVLDALKLHGGRGITWDNFPRGFALRSRISDLRRDGYKITTINERLESGCTRGRYVLLTSPSKE
jgi:hypothetical protein